MSVEIGYVVLYMKDTEQAAAFWQTNFDFKVKKEQEVGPHKVITIGTVEGQTNFELVPLALMENNPNNLNLAIPSICLHTSDLQAEHERLTALGVRVTDIADHGGRNSFAIFDAEDNAFACVEAS